MSEFKKIDRTIQLIEKLAANAWRPAFEESLDGWQLRFNKGINRRCNSVLPLDDNGGVKISKKIQKIEEFYQTKEQIPRFQISPIVKPSNLASILTSNGYISDAFTQVRISSSQDAVLKTTQNFDLEIYENENLSSSWLDTYFKVENYSKLGEEMREGTLRRIGSKTNFVLVSNAQEPISVGLGVCERNWVGIFCMATIDKYRNQGGATTVLNALAQWAIKSGAKNIYLQVMESNPKAIALYEKAGFSTLYNYFFMEKR